MTAAMGHASAQDGLALPMPVRPLALTHGFNGEAADRRACELAIRRGSKSFHLASMLLPRGQREAARALYAFCRNSDDLVDDPRASLASLDRLRVRLERIYAGDPAPLSCDRAFARAVRRHGIPRAAPNALLDGFEMDLRGRRYETLGEVKEYATGVAASVGVMMAMAMGARSAQALARAVDLGIAMQLTNIARDIGEDARNGRLYLPRDWLDEAGIDPAVFLASPRFTPALGAVVRRLLDEAEIHYRRGHAGIALLPRQCQPAIRAAALIYKAIGTQIAENGHDSVNRRARTTIMHKAALLLRASQADAPDHALQALPADPAAASLVAAAALAPAAPAGIAGRGQTLTAAMHPAAGRDRGSVERVIVILTALHARQSARPAAGRPGRDNGMTAHA